MTTPYGQPGGTTGQAGSSTGEHTSTTRGKAEEVKSRITEKARDTAHQAREKAGAAIEDRKGELAGSISSVAGAVRRSTDQLRDEGHERIAGYAESIASQFDRAAGYLRERDGRALREDIEDMARRQPAIVIGTAFALGLIAARFFRSSDRHTAVQRYDPAQSRSSFSEFSSEAAPYERSPGSTSVGTGGTGYGGSAPGGANAPEF
ncbi:MAG TPA: hypothetical protein VK012_00960 [Gemmatimonadales bacterium]|nr:hypothetical protein [Gemmatimonadales bacterium]